MRVAALAAERGRAAPFVLAAGRLAFCGGYDLDDPETLAEAAAAAGLGLRRGAGRRRRPAAATACWRPPPGACWPAGRTRYPRCIVGRTLFGGEHRIAEAAAAAGVGAGARRQIAR